MIFSSTSTPTRSQPGASRETIGWTFPEHNHARRDLPIYCEDCTSQMHGRPISVDEEQARQMHGDEPVYCAECDRLMLDGYGEE